jgi:hypothetical protein
MEKIRICTLKPGDRFILNGREFWVNRIFDGRVYFRGITMKYTGRMGVVGDLESLGNGSRQFVLLITEYDKKDVAPDIRQENSGIGRTED